jgi:hypothetical protein
MKKMVRIVLGLEGGIVQGASYTAPDGVGVEIVVRDYDTRDCDRTDMIVDPEHGDCFAYAVNGRIDPELVEVTNRQMSEVDSRREDAEAQGGAQA